MKVGLTFGKKMLLSYLFVLSMMVTIGLMAYCAMNSMARKTEFGDRVHQCLSLFRAVERSRDRVILTAGPEGSTGELASNDWKKAKDKFLSEVKKLSQTETLGEPERQIIETITESWKEYEVSFRRYILAMKAGDRDQRRRALEEFGPALAQMANTIVDSGEKLSGLAREAVGRVQAQMEIWLVLAIFTAVGLGLMIMLVNIHVWNRALGRAMNRLGRSSSRISTIPVQEGSQEDLKSQAQQIRQAMGELMELLGHEDVKREEQEKVKLKNEKE